MLWLRETEAGGFETPERRAALEARIEAITGAIGHDAVRKYYRQDYTARLRQLLAPAAPVNGCRRRGKRSALGLASGIAGSLGAFRRARARRRNGQGGRYGRTPAPGSRSLRGG